MFSSGIGSWAAAKRVAETHGTDDLVLLFADVKGRTDSPHAGEDEDNYRFLQEAAANIGGELVWLNEGRDIWQVFKDHRFLGNARIAKCSHVLKQEPCRKWLNANCDPADTVLYVGIDWTETHRLPAIEKGWSPFRVQAPLTEPPWVDKDDLLKQCIAEGVLPPRLYSWGASHSNCGMGCVRAGQGQFKRLYEVYPERYRYWEDKEQELRDYLGKDVAILRDRTGGTAKPLPLSVLRQRIEGTPDLVDADDIGGCGCMNDFDTEEPRDG